MYKLYYSPLACSLAVHTALVRVDADFELVNINIQKGQQFEDSFVKINKHSQVPVLDTGKQLITQVVSILLYLSDTFPEKKLMPEKSDAEYYQVLSLLAYLSSSVHPIFSTAFYPQRITAGNKEELAKKTLERMDAMLADFNERLEGANFLFGDYPYVTDYFLNTILNWPQVFGKNIKGYKNISAFKRRMGDLPEVAQATNFEMSQFR